MPFEIFTIKVYETAGVINPKQPGLYSIQIKTSQQNAYAVSNPYPISER